MNISNKTITFSAIGLLAFLAFIETFTVTNLLFPSFLNKPEYATYPLLKDGVGSDNYEVSFIFDSYAAKITYSPSGNFFMIEDHFYRKFDAQGNQVAELPDAHEWINPPFSPYLISTNGIYDFTETVPHKAPFMRILNDDGRTRFTKERWQELFDSFYEKSDVVLYGEPDSGTSRYPAYFKADRGWIVLYTTRSHIEIDDDYELGVSFAGYPAKYERMVLLKDPHAGVYSLDNYRLRDGIWTVDEDDFTYPMGYGVEILSFRKEYVSSEIAYTPIPIVYNGPGIYQIKAGNEVLNFQETAIRAIGSRASSNMTRFVLPEQYFGNTNVSFLEFRPGNNFDTSGSDGLYIIREKP